jgi:hypothetical protein
MMVICFSETLIDFHRATRRYIPKGITLHNTGVINQRVGLYTGDVQHKKKWNNLNPCNDYWSDDDD